MSSSIIADEIDAIIARAMAEYTGAPLPEGITGTPTEERRDQNVIPTNSGSILVDETTSRFSGAIWYEKIKAKNAIIAGCGGIGSYVCYLLARLHLNRIIIYDPDTVEAVNMSGQLYNSLQIGMAKVHAMAEMMDRYADYDTVSCYQEAYTSESITSNIMICGFDNMAARKVFFENWLKHVDACEDKSSCLFIDGRLAAETFQVFCIKGDDLYNIERYRNNWLFSDKEADATTCSYKQTTFMANMIGSIMTNLLVNFCANEANPLIPRDLPFLTEYTAETMYFKVIA